MCLDCHGSKTEQIQPTVWNYIQEKYPADPAYDYKEGDLRGVWHIIFSKKERNKIEENETRINKDLIFRERLATERKEMAIDRTFLSFIRTSLYFAIAGIMIVSLLKISHGWWRGVVFWIPALLILLTGIVKFYRQKKI